MADTDIERRVAALEGEVKDIKSSYNDMMERVIRAEETVKNTNGKVSDYSDTTKALIELTVVMKQVLQRLDSISERLDKHETRINDIERTPGKAAIKGWVAVIGIVASGIIGGLVTYLFK